MYKKCNSKNTQYLYECKVKCPGCDPLLFGKIFNLENIFETDRKFIVKSARVPLFPCSASDYTVEPLN
jgi:hypothetical protein